LAGRALGRKAGKETVASNLDPQIEGRPIGPLRPYERNARKHPPEQVAQIAASIREWGWTMPVLVDEQDLIIAGHGRVEAAKLIGIDTVPVSSSLRPFRHSRRGQDTAPRKRQLLSDLEV
jgi:ParB-like nuclease domain